MNMICPNCGTTIGEQIGGKLGIGLAGALLGGRVNPTAALCFGFLGVVLGHYYIDSAIRKCPQCGLVLSLARGLL